jgi:hypothetical protein
MMRQVNFDRCSAIVQVTKGIFPCNLMLLSRRHSPCKVGASGSREESDPAMGNSLPISLFAPPPRAQRSSLTYLVSTLVHGTVAVVILYGFIFAPRINMKEATDRYVMRRVDLDMPDPVIRRAGDDGMYPGSKPDSHQTPQQHDAPAAPASSIRQIPQLHLSDKTLVQPDLKFNEQVVKNTPLPSVLLWSADHPDVKLVVPPPPEILAAIKAKPMLTRPTPEKMIADVPLTSTPFATKFPMPMPASSTPINVSGPSLQDRIPQAFSAKSIQTSSAAMMSISEIQVTKGTIALPPANQTAKGNPMGALRPGTSGNSAEAGAGDSSSRGTVNGTRNSQGVAGNSAGAAGNAKGTNVASGANSGNGGANSGTGNNGGGGEGSSVTFTKVALPQNGQYGVVVVGNGMEEQFPETAALWGDRLIYSVYLHVGLPTSWILQYSLPLAAEARSAGNVHIEAPWPFYIVRPANGVGTIAADALMIHGFINESGHFEALAVVFPSTFRGTTPVLQAIQQWRFRPAKHNGQVAKVEVLLIIPEGAG